MTNSVLGRGLGSLIPTKKIKPASGENGPTKSDEGVYELAVDAIKPNPHQPRQNFDHTALESLINSIKVHGIIQPLIVLQLGDGYQLIAGERRLRAAKILGLKKVPALIRTATEQEKLELAIVENVQRQNLNPIEKADGYRCLMEEFDLTQEEVAKKVGQSRAVVANGLRLLTLPAEMQKALQEERITEGHAKVILSVASPEERQRLFKQILKDSMSVRRAESEARQVTVRRHTRRVSKDPNIQEKEELLQSALSTKVEIKKHGQQGTISIHFYSAEEFKGIIDKITK